MSQQSISSIEAGAATEAGTMGAERPARRAEGMIPFFILWSGQALSLIGTQAVQYALIWWLTIETGSATVLATAAFVGLFPRAVLGPFIGALVDRWNRKRVMFAADSFVALASAILAYLFLAGAARSEHVLLLLFVRAVGSSFHQPAMLASTTLMVPREHLSRIQGLNQSLQGALTIAAPPLGALLIGLLSMAGVMMVDVVTAAFAVAPLLFVHVPQPEKSQAAGDNARPSVWRDMVAGLRYILARPGHVGILIMAASINMCLVPAFSLLSLHVREELGGGPAQFGWMTSAFGVGMLLGGIVLGAWGGFRRRILTSLSALVGLGAAVLFVGLAPAAWLLAVTGALFTIGFMATLTNGPIQAVLQATVAPDFQGRVFTLYGSMATLTTPLGLLFAAPVAEILGVRAWYVLGGTVCMLMGSAAFLVPPIVHLEDQSG